MRPARLVTVATFLLAIGAGLSGQQQTPPQPPAGRAPVFRRDVNVILVDVDVRDKDGAPVRGLQGSDFEIREDGKPQEVVTFAFEEIGSTAKTIETSGTLAAAGGQKDAVPVVSRAGAAPAGAPPPGAAPAAVAADRGAVPLTSEEVAGHRVWVLLFDTSSMQPEDVQKAADAALAWAGTKMSPADLVAVASIGSTLQVLQDFTTDKDAVHRALSAFAASDGTAYAEVDASTMASDEAADASVSSDTTVDVSAQELDTFNNDVRLRGIKTICDGLAELQQKKALLYFSSGMQRNGADNQIEMRAATQACNGANVMIDPVDARGLQAVVPGGGGRQGSRGGVGAFSGRNVAQQFTQLASQQETLQALAVDTGGTAFTNTNDFGEAFDKVQKDISSYYILGYVSTNTARDGRYRSISVRLRKKTDAKIKAREGYYAERDFSHTAKDDREAQLQEQLMMALPATDVPLFVSSGYFRLPPKTVVSRRPVRPRSRWTRSGPGRTRVRSVRCRVGLRLLLRAHRGLGAGGRHSRLDPERHARRARLYPRRARVPGWRDQGHARRAALDEGDARLEAGALSDRHRPRPWPLHREDRRSREHDRPDGDVRNADDGPGSLPRGNQGEHGRAEHAAPERCAEREDAQPARSGQHLDRPEPYPRRRPRSEAVFLLRGVRPERERLASAAPDESRLLSRQGKSLRDSGRRANGRSTPSTARRPSSSSRCPPRGSSRVSTRARSMSSTRSPESSPSRGWTCTCALTRERRRAAGGPEPIPY